VDDKQVAHADDLERARNDHVLSGDEQFEVVSFTLELLRRADQRRDDRRVEERACAEIDELVSGDRAQRRQELWGACEVVLSAERYDRCELGKVSGTDLDLDVRLGRLPLHRASMSAEVAPAAVEATSGRGEPLSGFGGAPMRLQGANEGTARRGVSCWLRAASVPHRSERRGQLRPCPWGHGLATAGPSNGHRAGSYASDRRAHKRVAAGL
jgi:hypothetical protein